MMNKKLLTTAEAIANNAAVLMERGPGLDRRYQSFVIARDPGAKKILLGGLGGMGVGQMWIDTSPKDDNRIGYKNAPFMEYKK